MIHPILTKSLTCLFIYLLTGPLSAQDSRLAAGPMAGYNTPHEVTIWVQTRTETSVQFIYWPEKDTVKTYKTDIVHSQKSHAYTVEYLLEDLLPGTKYHYSLMLDGTKAPLADSLFFFTQSLNSHPIFSLATGSCAYIEDDSLKEKGLFKFGGRYEIFDQIAAKQPDYMLWLGDNIYLRGRDWETVEGVHYRYTHSRQTPPLNRFLRVGHHLSIWDDHDFGPNDSDGTWRGKDYTQAAFERFWGNPEPADSIGTYTTWRVGDVEVFLTDCRYYRSPVGAGGGAFFGDRQIEWLIAALKASNANFKLVAVGTQLFSNCNLGEGYCFGFPAEFERFMKRLSTEKIPGIVFLSGDKHYTEISRYDLPEHYPLYELTFSPLTSFPTPIRLKNTHRVKRTSYKRRNFGMLNFGGEPSNRFMQIELYNFKGKLIWERKLWASQLK